MINTNIPLDQVNAMSRNTMLEALDIRVIELGEDYLKGSMPVDNRTHQPMGLLHGGASCALIESLGSIGSSLIADMRTHNIVGIEINANHLKGAKEGIVIGTAKVVHAGRKTHVWQVDIEDENKRLICTGRLTVMVTPKQ